MARRKKTSGKPRASWKGTLRFGLVTFGVEAFNAQSKEAGAVAFHQLHKKCHSRIRYEKHCPIHGAVSNDEIVSGYEYSKGRYIEIEPEELDALRTQRERSLTIDSFIAADEIDPIYLDGRMYYLAPDGDQAREPYAILREALDRQEQIGIGQVVFSGREQVVLVRPYEEALHMAMLNYEAEIKDPDAVVGTVPHITGSSRELRLAEQLIEGMTDKDFDFGRYRDTYVEKMKALIDAKIEGREIVAPEEEEEPEVVNLMDALRKSIEHTQGERVHRPRSHAHHAKPHRSKRRRAS